ncbi:MAG: CHAT domain-containing protein [Planctomycetota bacterium]|nr:CHAT domain-containing protein [Planctomycetota bacterium]
MLEVERFAASPDGLRGSLNLDEAIIHFAVCQRRYFAWLIRSNYRTTKISLGGADELEIKVKAFTDAVATSSLVPHKARTETVQERGLQLLEIVRDTRDGMVDITTAGDQLREVLWQPIENQLGEGIQRLYIVPDGVLATTPFYAIPCGESKYLVDRYTLIWLCTPMDLIDQLPRETSAAGILLVGDPNLDAGCETRAGQIASSVGRAVDRANFKRLPGARVEVGKNRDIVESASTDRAVVLKGEAADHPTADHPTGFTKEEQTDRIEYLHACARQFVVCCRRLSWLIEC